MKKTSIKHWIIRYFIIVFVISTVLSAITSFFENYQNEMDEREQAATICAKNVSSLLNHQWSLKAFDEPMDDDAYHKVEKVMRQICDSYGLDYLYVYTVNYDETIGYFYYYYICVAEDDDDNAEVMQDLSRHIECTDQLDDAEIAAMSGVSKPQQVSFASEFGEDMSWVAPYIDRSGNVCALIGMDCNFQLISADILKSFLWDIIPFALFIIVGLLLLLFLIRRRIITPIGIISNSMMQFARDSSKKPDKIVVERNDEIGEIAESYEKMTDDIVAYINNIEKLTKDKLETEMQLTIARQIQNGLVPEKMNLEEGRFSVCAMTNPAVAVGGDFYDCFERSDGQICIVIGDVSGKGIAAAIGMSMFKTAIREKLKANLSPAETLNQTNDEFLKKNPVNLFATAFVAVLDIRHGELVFANAGHTYPILIQDEVTYLEVDSGMAIGLFEDADLQDNKLMLTQGQGILLYTDGVTEAVNRRKEFFGNEQLIRAVKDATVENSYTAEDIILVVNRSIINHCMEEEPFDDRAMLALLYTGDTLSYTELIHKGLDVDISSFNVVKNDVIHIMGNTPKARQVLLAADEALTNIVNYSGATSLEYECSINNDKLKIMFSDNGTYFDPTKEKIEDKSFESLDEGGMGISIIRQFASSMIYERREGCNVLTLFFDTK